jgi:hypothetical protein
MDTTTRLLQNLLRAAQGITFLVPIFLVPLTLALWFLHGKDAKLKSLMQQVAILEKKAVILQEKKEKQERIWQQTKKADPLYLAQVIEALPLQLSELQKAQGLLRQYPDKRPLQDRLAFLQSDRNRIQLVQQVERIAPFFHETELKFVQPVQMNGDDLRNFLVAVEGDDYSTEQERPLLVIKEFKLSKFKTKADDMVYNIDVEMIKRSP